MRNKIVAILLMPCLLCGCGMSAGKEVVTETNVPVSETRTDTSSGDATGDAIALQEAKDVDEEIAKGIHEAEASGDFKPDSGLLTACYFSMPLRDGKFDAIPEYHMDDFYWYSYNGSTLDKNGNIITVLSMLYSYAKSDWITPDLFADDFSEYLDNSGNLDNVLNIIASEAGYTVTKEVYTHEKAVELLNDNNLLLLKINHSSVLSEGSTALLLTGIDSTNNYFYTRDPDGTNMNAFSMDVAKPQLLTYETYYNAKMVSLIAAGCEMYVIDANLGAVETSDERTAYDEIRNIVTKGESGDAVIKEE